MPKALFRAAAVTLATLMALPVVAPLACRLPADVELSVPDTDRMGQFETSRVQGLAEAMLADSADDRAAAASLFSKGIQVIDTIPDGDYRCRTIKLGGMLPLNVYGYFDCTISEDGTRIEKTSGSQRFVGTLMPTFQALFYQGAQHYNGDPPREYGDDREFDQVGCLYRVKGKAEYYRLELPFPLHESTHDVIELVLAR